MHEYDKTGAIRSHIYTAIGITTFTIIACLIAWYALDFIFLIFSGVLLAVFLRSLSNLINQVTRLPEKVCISFSLIFLLLGFISVIALIAPIASYQISQLSNELSNDWIRIEEYLQNYFDVRSLSTISNDTNLNQIFPKVLVSITGVFSTTFGFLTSFLIFLFIGVFLAFDPDVYVSGFLKLIPPLKRPRAKEILDQISEVLYWWLMATLISMSAVAVLIWLGLYLIGVPFALGLGVMAGLLTFIPTLGALLAAIPSILLAAIQDPIKAVYVALLYMSVHAIESYFLTPTVQQKAISLPPVLTVTTQLFMTLLAGIPGLIVATPLLATIMVLIKTLYIEDTLGDKV